MCFVRISEQTVRFPLYIITRTVFITEVESVYCAVRTKSIYNTVTFRPKRVKGEMVTKRNHRAEHPTYGIHRATFDLDMQHARVNVTNAYYTLQGHFYTLRTSSLQ